MLVIVFSPFEFLVIRDLMNETGHKKYIEEGKRIDDTIEDQTIRTIELMQKNSPRVQNVRPISLNEGSYKNSPESKSGNSQVKSFRSANESLIVKNSKNTDPVSASKSSRKSSKPEIEIFQPNPLQSSNVSSYSNSYEYPEEEQYIFNEEEDEEEEYYDNSESQS